MALQCFEDYRRRINAVNNIETPIAIRKRNDMLMENAWFRDPTVVKAKIYKHKEGSRGFEYETIATDYLKLIHRTVQENIGSDVDFYIQFRPGIFYPVGSYVDTLDIYPDENGNETWTTWLLTNRADDQQFTLYNALPCNYLFRFVNKNKLYQSLGVVRSLNSYSSGLSPKASTILVPNDMKSLWIPSDSCSMVLYYNKRVIVSDPRRMPPLTWSISKVDDMSSPGVSKYALVQAAFNPDTDIDEKWGYVADIHADILIEDSDDTVTSTYSGDIVLYIGAKNAGTIVYKEKEEPQIRFGSFVKMTTEFLDNNGIPITGLNYLWELQGLDSSEYSGVQITGNEIIFKINRDYKLGGKRFFAVCKSDDGNYEAKRELEIIVL